MKKSELTKIIEAVVRKEVKKQLNEIFIKENKSTSIAELISDPVTTKSKKRTTNKYKTYTENKVLNKVLNETVGGLPQGDGKESYPMMGGGTYDTSRVHELAGHGKSNQDKRDIGAVESIKSRGVNVDDVPDHITDALTKDYGPLMKKFNK
jgi:hypothetical protein